MLIGSVLAARRHLFPRQRPTCRFLVYKRWVKYVGQFTAVDNKKDRLLPLRLCNESAQRVGKSNVEAKIDVEDDHRKEGHDPNRLEFEN